MAKRLTNGFVRTTTELASRLGVSRQAVHYWRHLPGAPRIEAGFWNVAEWKSFSRKNALNSAKRVSRNQAASQIRRMILENLPESVSRTKLSRLRSNLLSALHTLFPNQLPESDLQNCPQK
jgi:uncharacterized protein (DUF2267 family)